MVIEQFLEQTETDTTAAMQAVTLEGSSRVLMTSNQLTPPDEIPIEGTEEAPTVSLPQEEEQEAQEDTHTL